MRPALLCLVALLATLAGNRVVESQRALPAKLQRCYSNDGRFVPSLPLNLQVVLDVLRKIERQTFTSLTMRTLSTALLKRFKLDGIVYSDDLPEREGVLRYAARGSQRAKNLMVERLIPGGDPTLVPEAYLRPDELCLLHFALSSTVWQRYDDTEEASCKPQLAERSAKEMSYRSISTPADRCPKESGVVLTRYNTVALGTVLAAIAAALEPQLVKTRLLLELPVDPDRAELEEDDFLVSREQVVNDRSSMWLQTVGITDTQIDNAWAATVAGDLAELAVYQGPLYESRMYLGATGFWNSTISPRVFYFWHDYDHFDFTRAEIIGGIDGLVIAKNLDKWLQRFGSLRLSQVLDMYYSEGGVVFDRKVKACRRADQFPLVGPKSTLEEQTYAASQVLAYLNSIAAMSDAALQGIVVNAVEHFVRYTEQSLFLEEQCRGPVKRAPRLELVLAFDGSWTRDYTSDFLAVLVEDFDVSAYGSRIGMVHGETGQWLLNVTSSPSDAHRAIYLLKNIEWPTDMKLHLVFESVLGYLDGFWAEKRHSKTIGDMGQAVVLLAPRITMSKAEVDLALSALRRLKDRHPEVYFLYYTCDSRVDALKRLVLSDEDQIVKTLRVDDISRLLAKVPMTLRPVGCNPNVPGVRLQLEDYVDPGESNVYRLHPDRRIKTKRVVVTLHGVGYGTLRVCWWNQWRATSKRTGTYCKALPLHGDVSLSDYNTCDENGNCPNTYIQVSNVTSLTKCTEFGCRSPEQVRYIIRMENFQCSVANAVYANVFLTAAALVIFTAF
ncbi:uncharacterized protein LOC106647810 [Copidosoma floridanum]|uniref:uncharacterized protein LOC106647810 n=1 Tax=Copidosoma floridanum TaxID=29053 RepID=UPI000C6F98FE|nr:uncharacterized protein LOC106647810 [Copidosoma floridanum]